MTNDNKELEIKELVSVLVKAFNDNQGLISKEILAESIINAGYRKSVVPADQKELDAILEQKDKEIDRLKKEIATRKGSEKYLKEELKAKYQGKGE